MKKFCKKIKALLFVGLYLVIHYLVNWGVQMVYLLWKNTREDITLSELSTSAVNNAYALTVISSVICFWIYLIIGHMRKEPLDRVIENEKKPPVITAMAVCLAVGGRLLVTVYYYLSQEVTTLKESIEDAAATSPELTTTAQLLVALFAIIVVAPLFEEFLFRGIIMNEFLKIMRPWAAIGLQGILFGIIHGVLFQSIFAAVMGIFIGIVYFRTKSLKTAVVCHSVFNLSSSLTVIEMDFRTGIVLAVIGVILVAFSLTYIIQNCKRNNNYK